MKVLVVGPSDTKSRGGMATVISGIRNSKVLNEKYDIDIFASYIDGNIITRLMYSVYAYIKFLFIYKKYDLFHIHNASFGSTFRKRHYIKRIKKANKKAIAHIHGAKYLIFYDGLNDKKKQKVLDYLNSADMVIALSDDWKEKFEYTFHITNCVSLNNGIDTEEFEKAVCNVEEHKNRFAFMGRLGERKGAYDLVDAVEKTVKNNPDIEIIMAGDGEIEKVKQVIKNKNLENNIKVIGWIGFNEKIELLKESATLVLPSYNEGLPMAVLEGMAAGKAIISTTVGAIPEVIKEENGILIEAGDVDALSDALIKCSSEIDVIKQMSINNKKKIDDEFSMKIMHKKLIQYYECVMQEN